MHATESNNYVKRACVDACLFICVCVRVFEESVPSLCLRRSTCCVMTVKSNDSLRSYLTEW